MQQNALIGKGCTQAASYVTLIGKIFKFEKIKRKKWLANWNCPYFKGNYSTYEEHEGSI